MALLTSQLNVAHLLKNRLRKPGSTSAILCMFLVLRTEQFASGICIVLPDLGLVCWIVLNNVSNGRHVPYP